MPDEVRVMRVRFAQAALAAWLAAACLAGCRPSPEHEAAIITGGDVARGRAALVRYGCVSCHTIPGITGANATVGPPLDRIALRGYLGGHLTNSPANMMKWIQHPQQVDPKNAMPELGVTDQDARDMTAFLYTLQ